MENRTVRPRKRRRWAYVSSALLVGLALAAVLVELAFRWFCDLPPCFAEFQQAGMHVATRDGDVALLPGHRGSVRVGDGKPTSVSINGLGLRGPELGPKAATERRVLMLGDSLVFGSGVEEPKALPARLADAMRGGGVEVTVGNAGVPGYGCSHAVAQMARLAEPFGADAFVLCAFLGDDARDEVSPQRAVYAGLLLQGAMARLVHRSWRARLALRSRAASWLESWVMTNEPDWSLWKHLPPDPEDEARRAGMPPEAQQKAGLFLDVIDESKTWAASAPPVLPRVAESLRKALSRALEVADERQLVLVVLPTVWHVVESKRVEKLRELGLPPAEYERGLAQRRWMQVATQLGIKAFDATPILAAEPDPEQLFLADGGHLGARGNEVVAKWLATELLPLLR